MSEVIIGVDPGTRNIGFAVFRETGWKLWGLSLKSSPAFFIKVYKHLKQIVRVVKPTILVAESMPLVKNAKMVESLSMVVGVLGVLAYEEKIKFVTVLPSVWKKAVGGFYKGIDNITLIQNRYQFNFDYNEHAASACGVVTAVLEEGGKIDYGKIKWIDFSTEEWKK